MTLSGKSIFLMNMISAYENFIIFLKYGENINANSLKKRVVLHHYANHIKLSICFRFIFAKVMFGGSRIYLHVYSYAFLFIYSVTFQI